MRKILALCFVLPYFVGCTSLVQSYETNKAVKDNWAKASALASKKPQKKPFLMETSRFYVDTKPVKVSDTKLSLIEDFPGEIVISDREPLSIHQIAERITVNTRIPVSFLEDSSSEIDSGLGHGASGDIQQMMQSLPMSIRQGSGNGIGKNSMESYLSSVSGGKKVDVRFKGKLPDLLDQVTARLNLFWRYDRDEHRIVIHQYDTQTFTLMSMPGDIDLNFNVSNKSSTSIGSGGGSGGGGGGSRSTSASGQSVDMNSTIKSWDDISSSIKNMLSPKGRIFGNAAMGTVTVTDTPVVLADVRRYIDAINKNMGRQVTLDVMIYNVEIEDSRQGGIDWKLVYDKADEIGMAFVAPAKSAADAVNGFAAQIMRPSSNYSGSSAIVRALEDQGKVSLVYTTQVVTLNNNPVPVKVAEEISYLAATSGGVQGASGGTGSVLTTSLQPGKVVTGLTMTLMPKMIDANQMMMQMALDISSLKGMKDFDSGNGNKIQLPQISSKNFLQKVAMHNGETLILSGFNEVNQSNKYSTTFDLPGGINSSNKKIVTLLMVTPRITDGIQ